MASSKDKVLQFHISRLKDKNIDVLLRTIQELVKFGAAAEDALPELERIFRTHEDTTVKKAAQLAGYEIYQKVKAENRQKEA